MKINLLSISLGKCGLFGFHILEIEHEKFKYESIDLFSFVYDAYSEINVLKIFFLRFEIPSSLEN